MLDTFDVWSNHYDIDPVFVIRRPVESLAPELDERGWGYHAVDYMYWSDKTPPRNPEDIFYKAVRNSRAVLGIERIIDDVQPEAVMTNSLVCPWAALAAHFKRVPHVWFVREYGDLDHGREFEIGREQTLEDVGHLSELVVANSRTMQAYLADYIPESRLTTLYTPFDVEALAERSQQKVASPFLSPESLKCVTVNNIAANKGQVEAVAAIGRLNHSGQEAELAILGSGGKYIVEQVKQTATEYGIGDKVHFLGLQPDTMPYIGLADVGIMASWHEAFGRATFECMAGAIPVVGSNAGATPELIDNGENGLLFAPGDSKEMASQLQKYADDPVMLQEHGANARAKTERMMGGEHGPDAVYERIDQSVNAFDPSQPRGPINYLHRWFEYLDIAKQGVDSVGLFTFRRMLWLRAKRLIRPVYLRIQEIKAKLKH